MRIFISKKQSLKEIYTDYKIKDYINKYLKELQRHFDVSDKKMYSLVREVCFDLMPFDFIKKILYTKTKIEKFFAKEIKWK